MDNIFTPLKGQINIWKQLTIDIFYLFLLIFNYTHTHTHTEVYTKQLHGLQVDMYSL